MQRTIIFLVIISSCTLLFGQRFTDIQAGLTGVSESTSNWIDFDQDGATDIFVTGDFYDKDKHNISTKLYKNIKRDRFSGVYSPIVKVYRGDFDWADYNNDGVEDLFIIGKTISGDLVSYLYSNNRTANFRRIPVSIPGYNDGSVEWGDFDRDGDFDLLITGQTKNGLASNIYRNDRNNKFTKINAGLPGIQHGVGRWADYDNDGDLDVIISGNDRSGKVITHLFKNDSSRFKKIGTNFRDLKLSDIAWADYDNDGDQDFVIIGESASGKLESILYSNENEDAFLRVPTNFISVRSGSVDWGDMDHDGDLDLLLTGESQAGPISKVYRNDRNGLFTDINAGLIGLYMSDGHWGDYDNDEDLDIVISGMSNNYGFVSRVYRNDKIHIDTAKTKGTVQSDDIWNNSVVVVPKPDNIYYYVFASCYCDINGDGMDEYHAFFSPVIKQNVQYELQMKFNKIVRNLYPQWADFDQAHIIENGFPTKQQGLKSKRNAVKEYQSTQFKVHDLVW
jgi:hypothetical protein